MKNLLSILIIFFLAQLTEPKQDLEEQNQNEDINPLLQPEHEFLPKDPGKRTIFGHRPSYSWGKHVGIHPSGFKYLLGYGPIDVKYVPMIKPVRFLRPVLHASPNFRPIAPIRLRPVLQSFRHIKPILPIRQYLPPVRTPSPEVESEWQPNPPPVVPVHIEPKPYAVAPVVPPPVEEFIPAEPPRHVHPIHPVHPVHPIQPVHPIHPVPEEYPLHVQPPLPAPVQPPLPLHNYFFFQTPLAKPPLVPPTPLLHVSRANLSVLPFGAVFPSEVLQPHTFPQPLPQPHPHVTHLLPVQPPPIHPQHIHPAVPGLAVNQPVYGRPVQPVAPPPQIFDFFEGPRVVPQQIPEAHHHLQFGRPALEALGPPFQTQHQFVQNFGQLPHQHVEQPAKELFQPSFQHHHLHQQPHHIEQPSQMSLLPPFQHHHHQLDVQPAHHHIEQPSQVSLLPPFHNQNVGQEHFYNYHVGQPQQEPLLPPFQHGKEDAPLNIQPPHHNHIEQPLQDPLQPPFQQSRQVIHNDGGQHVIHILHAPNLVEQAVKEQSQPPFQHQGLQKEGAIPQVGHASLGNVIQPGQTDLQIPLHLPQHPNFTPLQQLAGGEQFSIRNFEGHQQFSAHQNPEHLYRPSLQLELPLTNGH